MAIILPCFSIATQSEMEKFQESRLPIAANPNTGCLDQIKSWIVLAIKGSNTERAKTIPLNTEVKTTTNVDVKPMKCSYSIAWSTRKGGRTAQGGH